MDLTDDNIDRLKSLVRVSMAMYDEDNWKNGEYFGDARKFWDGAMIGIDVWVKKMRESQKTETSDEALPIHGVSSTFKVGTYTIVTEDMPDWCHWSEGLKMVIEKDGVVIKLEGEEIEKLVKSLPRTFGGTY